MKKETRNLCLDIDDLIPQIETRDDESKTITGYAAVYYREGKKNTEFKLWDDFVERIAPGAFDSVLKQDVRALFNHDSNHVLGRTKGKTLRLSVDEKGLKYEIDVPDTQTGRDLLTSIKRGDVTGSSFSFMLGKNGAEINDDGKRVVRTITKVSKLFDVGPVTFPAYEGTAAKSRDEEEAQRELEQYRQEMENLAAAETEKRRKQLKVAKLRLTL